MGALQTFESNTIEGNKHKAASTGASRKHTAEGNFFHQRGNGISYRKQE
jgi:hypothetical protein